MWFQVGNKHFLAGRVDASSISEELLAGGGHGRFMAASWPQNTIKCSMHKFQQKHKGYKLLSPVTFSSAEEMQHGSRVQTKIS